MFCGQNLWSLNLHCTLNCDYQDIFECFILIIVWLSHPSKLMTSCYINIVMFDSTPFEAVCIFVVVDYDFFEVQILDEFEGSDFPPPGIALASPCPQNLSPEGSSNFRLDFVRFLAINGGK